MSDRDASHLVSELQEARADLDAARRELTRLQKLVLEQTSVTCRGQRYWPDWVNRYFNSVGVMPKEGE
jgi:hypothetical protein